MHGVLRLGRGKGRPPWFRLVIALVAVFGLAPAVISAGEASQDKASAFVRGLADQALTVLQRSDLSLDEREGAFRDILSEGFDLNFIGRFALGRKYRSATPEQRDTYQRLFAEFILKTYSARLGGYSGETFHLVKAAPVGKKDILVDTKIERSSGPSISCSWRVRAFDDRYRIVDIVVEGVSMALTQRQEFAAVMRRGGIEALIQALSARADKISVVASK